MQKVAWNKASKPLKNLIQLFPFDGTRRLGRDIVENAIDARDLARDAGADLVQNGVGDLLDRSGHSVLGVDGAQDSRPALVAAVVLDTDRLDIGDDHEILPYMLSKAVLVELVAVRNRPNRLSPSF